jgi:hypothetical protein
VPSGGGAIIPFTSGGSGNGTTLIVTDTISNGYQIGFGNFTQLSLDNNANITSSNTILQVMSFASLTAPRDGTLTSISADFMYFSGGPSGVFTIYVQLYENKQGTNTFNKIGDAITISDFSFGTYNDYETITKSLNIPISQSNRYLVIFYGTSPDVSKNGASITGLATAVLNIQ